ncbi:hypothetical protein K4K49_003414 [Colletotrichum sp. SAR 10_70]|nr:hypothetical protein K4K50_003443 [Colletotrichum sp. SAR 10_71]KAI8199062.1 hypothetical protein K4K49_003414 [Colletotrichum sp. SAR 10_70]
MTDAPMKPQGGVGDIDRGVLPSSDLKLQELDAEHQENAVGYREYLEAIDLEVSDKELRRLRWKLDLTILPMFLVTQALQFMDKTSLNYANLFGYQAALSLKGQQFNYLSAKRWELIFFMLGGVTTTQTTQLKSVGDAVQIVALLIGGTVILNVKDSSVANLLCTISAACMAYLPESNTWGRLVSFWLVNSQSVGFTVSLTTISSNMAGYTHRSLASAMVFTAYCWGNFAGPFVVKQSEAPHFQGATIGLLVGYAIKLICHLTLLIYMYLVNRHRNKKYGEPNRESSKEAGMRDQTEFENKDFRYAL